MVAAKAFYSMLEWESEIERADKSRREAEYNLLLEKFPNLEDFDVIGTKHFVRYDEAVSSVDEAIERYKDISKFLIVDRERPAGHMHHSFGREEEIFRERIRRYKGRSAFRSLSLAGADRFRTSSYWRRNAISASRTACDLNNPTSQQPSNFKRLIIQHDSSPLLHLRQLG